MKRKFTMILGLLLACSMLLSACRGESSQSPDTGTKNPQTPADTQTSSAVTPAGAFPVVEKPVTYRFLAPQVANIPDLAKNDFTTMYEKKTNVHIEWELVPGNALVEKKSIALASGQYPDAFFACQITKEEEMLYGLKGVFLPLNKLMDTYNPELKKLMGKDPLVKQQITALDGNIYSYPNPQITLHVTLQNRMWINTTWLKQLNLKTPATPQEYAAVLNEFKTKDPNKNGKQDDIPLVIPSVKSHTGIAFLMCPYIYYDGGDGFIVSDAGKVDVAYNKPGWKEGLQFIRKLYSSGLIDKTSFTLTPEQAKQLVENQSAMIVGGIPSMAPSGFANLAGDRHKNFDALIPLKGPSSLQTTAWFPYQHVTGTLVITKAAKNPEIIARWVDWLYTWEGALTAREGPENVGWKRPEPGVKSYTGEQATWERLSNYGQASNFKWDGMSFPHNMMIHPEQRGADDIYSATGQAQRLYEAARTYEPFHPKNVLPPLYMSTEVVKDYSKMKTDINKFVEDYTVRFITGAADIDKDWDSYISSFQKLDLPKYIKNTQEAYDIFLKNSK